MPVGRPTKYDPKYCQMLIGHMAKGFSFESFAGRINTCPATIYKWANEFPAFSEAKELAYAKNLDFWEAAGIEGMWNEKEGRSLNASVWIFNMKNRHKWRDRQEIEAIIDNDREKIRKMSMEELKDFIKKHEEEGSDKE
jgi:hypothetical protein